MKRILSAIIVFLIFPASGCVSIATVKSNLVASSEIYQDYRIHASRLGVQATAVFRVGGFTGTTVDIDAPAGIEFDGKPMEEIPDGFLKGTDYALAVEGFRPVNEFVLTTHEGNVYRNSVELEAVEFTVGEITYDRSGSAAIPVTRIPTNGSESVEIILTNEDFVKSQAERIEESVPFSFEKTKNTLVLGSLTQSKLPIGEATLKMSIIKQPQLKEATRYGGIIRAVYYAKPLKVRIVK